MGRLIATLRAVADAAGVHVATASRALNTQTSHLVNPQTRQRILDAATRLDYRANTSASALRTGRSRLVGILLPGLSNPVYAPIIEGAAEVLDDSGVGTMVGETGQLCERAVRLVRDLAARRVDGLLLAVSLEGRNAALEEAIERQLPLVLLNRALPGSVSVGPDNMQGIGMAVEHLAGLGHRVIGYLGGNLHSIWRSERINAFESAMARLGLALQVPPCEVAGYGREAGRARALELLVEHPRMTALVCGNDMIAVGVYDAARELGRQVPAQLSVTGHNDLPFMDALAPPLTTVRVDFRRMGALSAGLLLRRIAGDPGQDILLPAELIVRGSTAPPAAA